VILADILEFLQQRDAASLGEIARHVKAEPAAVRDMLATLQRKGKVHRPMLAGGCGSTCQQCAAGNAELYASGPPRAASSLPTQCGIPPET
jgi:hypothetical protein